MLRQPLDTTEEGADVQRAVWRAMPDEEKFRQTLSSSTAIRDIAFAGIRGRHPDYEDRQVKLAWLRMTMGRDAFSCLFPHDNVEP